jgi:uncharacterized protein YciI
MPKLDAYTIVFLRRPADAPQFSDEELEALQRGHLAFHDRLRHEGHVVFNGPLLGQPDESLRGIAIYRTSVDEARRIAEQDPSVQARRLAIDACTWLMQPGALGDRPASTVDID